MLLHFKVHHTHAEQPGGCSPTWHFLAIYVHHSQTMAVNLGRARPTGTNHTIQNSFHPFRRIGAVRTAVWQAATTAPWPAYPRRQGAAYLGYVGGGSSTASFKPRQVNLYQRWPGAMDSANKSISSSSFGKSCRNHDSFSYKWPQCYNETENHLTRSSTRWRRWRQRRGGVRRWRRLALGYFIEHF